MKLSLEILNGPLDGQIVTLETETVWGKEGDSPLSFPWDTELGVPQARVFPEGGNWWIEGHDAPHGTYCLNRQKKIEEKKQVEKDDLLKASETWVLINQID
ncbi:MAG: hypothetical protein GY792_01805 [Gammaproteobacteria bacterium]|nr:hypothetical protein [Gammaproteobacteria bacterium]